MYLEYLAWKLKNTCGVSTCMCNIAIIEMMLRIISNAKQYQLLPWFYKQIEMR